MGRPAPAEQLIANARARHENRAPEPKYSADLDDEVPF
jgi:hypothetical protein